MSERYDCLIKFPSFEQNSTIITITGYEKNAIECKEEIEERVKYFESIITQEITVDKRVLSRKEQKKVIK